MKELLLGSHRRSAAARSSVALVVAGVALYLALPSLSRYNVVVIGSLLLYVAAASAWNLIGGVAGQFSLATSAVLGTGSYTTIMLLRGSPIPLGLVLALAGVGGALVSAIVGLVLFRLRGFYFTIGTLAAAMAALAWMTTWSFTGATTGISAPLERIPDGPTIFVFALVLAVVAIAVSIAIVSSGVGLRMMAVRDDEDIADSLGVSPFQLKMLAMVVSGALISIAGGVFALQEARVEPFSAFDLSWSVSIAVMAIIGGLGTVWGPPLGAVIIYYGVTVQLESIPALGSLVAGALLIVVIKFLPGGIVDAVVRLARTLVSRTRRSG